MLQFSPLGTFGLLTAVSCWVFAVILFRIGAEGGVARKLSVLLVIEGVTLASSNYVEMFLTPQGFASPAYQIYAQVSGPIHYLGDCAMLALYPVFLAVALKTRLARPFSNKRVQWVTAGVAAACFVVFLLGPIQIGLTLIYLMMALLFGFALIASFHAWHVAEPGIARTRAGIFAVAFGIRDICWGFVYSYAVWSIFTGKSFDEPGLIFLGIIYALGTLLAIPLITYGILRTQLFDLDLKVRWTIKQSTIAGVFVAVMFMISEGANQFLETELGGFAGLLAAGVVMAFLAPLQRFADRVAGAAMPNAENTPEYAAFRKMQVYEAAVDEALQEGGISDKERSLLVRLRDSLEITESDADAIELELQTRHAETA